ncbi:MAG: cysteine--tRNA ligase [Myxococcota bacterium]
MSDIQFYNTRTRRKEPFVPIEPGRVGIYSCGPTVYGPQHIGNLVPYMFADLLRRTLEDAGLEVRHVINITDVGHLTSDADAGEDKMEKAAAASGLRAEEIAERYTEMWLRDRRRVGCLEAHVYCKATEHIAEQIELARRIEAKGCTYCIEDGLYFDVSKFPRYAEFARLDLEGQGDGDGARIEQVPGKRNPADFALWKFAQPGVQRQQEWDSPWGRGFPGWHLECSAMSSKYLGEHFDIHTGGVDHIPVHHSNEIAQSECAFGCHPWVNFWMHNEFYNFQGQKMSKSKGNIALLDDLVARGIEPRAYRYFFLQAHYRQQVTLTDEALQSAAVGYRRLLGQAAAVRGATGEGDRDRQAPYRERFRAALRDDLNAPRAMAVTWEVARSSDLSEADRRDLLLHFDELLALDLAEGVPAEERAEQESDPRIDALVAERQAARKAKDFATADRIRDELAAEGISLVDTPEGARWKRG